MPYTKDPRCGAGWFEANVNSFFTYLDDHNNQIIVKQDFCESEVKYHNQVLEELIEEKMNEYISWHVFGERRNQLDEDDILPKLYDNIWMFVEDCVRIFIERKSSWYKFDDGLDH